MLSRLLLCSTLIAASSFALPAAAQSAPAGDVIESMVKKPATPAIIAEASRIQIALLLDTSNSMDGLIDQAKSQLWTLVNELAEGEKNGLPPQIELALYEYGNSDISVSKGYIRQVLALTSDLDGVSEALFALKTNGGQEYAGQVIDTALSELEWSKSEDDMKLIIIAGNEPFTQGQVSYQSACARAKKNGVIIDTIHCGDEQTGIDTKWKDGAQCSGGIYMTINQDEQSVHVPSPYDDKILTLNKELNKTYIGYGMKGAAMKERQAAQDSNAASMSVKSALGRAASKANAPAYKNESWDLVDAYEADEEVIMAMPVEQLPDEMKGLSPEDRAAFIKNKQEKRTTLQAEIAALSKQQQAYVNAKRKEMSETKTLDNVMVTGVRKQAEQSGFAYKKETN